MKRVAPLLLSLLALSCGSSETRVRLRVLYDGELTDLALVAEVELPGERPRRLDSSRVDEVLLRVPETWSDQTLRVQVDGYLATERVASSAVELTVLPGETVEVEALLTRLPCGAWCSAGATRCQGDSVVVCEERDDDSCLEWSDAVRCVGDSPFCSLGACSAACVDECAEGEQRCTGPAGLKVCGDFDADACLEWGEPQSCEDGEVCSAGQCRETCVDECAEGETTCSLGGTARCGDLNLDGCLEWGPVAPCEAGESCEAGECIGIESCTDECSGGQCTADGRLTVCGNFDLDACLEPSPGVSCIPADPCMEGRCTVDGCEVVARVCNMPPPATCVGDSLRTFSASGVCDAGRCEYTATDTTCPFGCEAAACAGGCDGVVCDSPPADECAGDILRTFTPSGTCSDGVCSYEPLDTDCEHGCADGACRPAPCAANERVRRGECVACPPGETNEAGDDPSGRDTRCTDRCMDVFGVDCADFDQGYLKSDVVAGGQFGFSVDVHGNNLAVGHPLGAGRASVFSRAGSTWSRERILSGPTGDSFGEGVAIASTDWAVAVPEASDTGRVVIAPLDGSDNVTWGPGGRDTDFGGSIAFDGNWLASRAYDSFVRAPLIYLFRRAGSSWEAVSSLPAPVVRPFSAAREASYGRVMAFSPTHFFVGMPGHLPSASSRGGGVRRYELSSGRWSYESLITIEDTARLGDSVAADGDWVIVGDPAWSSERGQVFVEQRVGPGTWERYGPYAAPQARDGMRFGHSVAISGAYFAVGAPHESSASTGVDGDMSDSSAPDAGAVYLYKFVGGTWQFHAYIKASNTDAGDLFGWSVALDGSTLVVGAPNEAGSGTGVGGDQSSNGTADSGAVYVRRIAP